MVWNLGIDKRSRLLSRPFSRSRSSHPFDRPLDVAPRAKHAVPIIVCEDAGMTQPCQQTQASKKPDRLSWLWLSSLCWLGSGFGWAVLAQTPSDLVVPGAQDLLPAESIEAPPPIEAPVESPDLYSEPLAAPPPTEPIAEPADVPTRSADLELTSPIDPAEAPDAPNLVAPNLANQAEAAFGEPTQPTAGFGNFIDQTPYSLGATDNPNVVLSERSTGCEATVQPGQNVPSSLCSFTQEYTAGQMGTTIGGSSGEFNLGVVYSGGRTTPSGRDYYNLTIRPAARLTSGNFGLLFPLSIPAAITSAFGWRLHPVLGESRFHSGTDLGAPFGTPVLAAFSGKVAVADFMGGYGLAVVLQHQNGSEETLYGHLSEIFVKPGEEIKQGEVIGRVGSTGLSTGPHLHFEFRKQTPDGWVVMDAGSTLEYALSQFVNALKLGLAYPPKLALLQSTSFNKALEMAKTKVSPTTITIPDASPSPTDADLQN